jgi:hypothetical protein
MSRDELDDDLQRFLRDCVQSYEELEVLLLLHRDRSKEWTPVEAAAALRLTSEAAGTALENLLASALLRRRPERRYRCEPGDPALEALIAKLADASVHNRIRLVQVMSKNALDRLRVASLRTFAEAFRIKGPPKDG